MSTTTSPAILKALSAIVNDSLNYVSLIEYMEEQYYLVLGRFSFYFIKNDLSQCQASIKYAHLERCLTDEKKVTLIQLQLSDNRDPTHPQKLNIYSQDRITLIDSFICYWQIDYMYRYINICKNQNIISESIIQKFSDLMEDNNDGSAQVSDEQRKKVMNYLQQLYIALKELIDQTRTAIKENDDDFDHITTCLQKFKDDSTQSLIDLSQKNFNEQIKLEDNLHFLLEYLLILRFHQF